MKRLLVFLLFSITGAVIAEPATDCPEAPQAAGLAVTAKSELQQTSIAQSIVRCVPELTNSIGSRWPLVLWDNGDPDDWDKQTIDAVAKRGIVPAIRLNEAWLQVALRLVEAGLPVIAIEAHGSAPPWPYDQALASESSWTLTFENEASIPRKWRRLPLPTRLNGWAASASALKQRLELFKKSGVEIDAFWLDYENQPAMLDYRAAREATNAAGWIPPEALRNEKVFAAYRRQLWIDLVSTYVAAPIREIFPQAAVTNWLALLSVPNSRTHSWRGEPHPITSPGMFTHTNPVAYGVDSAFLAVNQGGLFSFSPQRIDATYLHILLRQASEDAQNRNAFAPWLGSAAWVARWVPDLGHDRVPVMGRKAYREVLRHLWMRDLDAMAIFNHRRSGFAQYQLAEVQDAVQAYGEYLDWRGRVNQPEPMNLAVPPTQPSLVWSGMRDGNRVVLRVFNPFGTEDMLELEPWRDVQVKIVSAPGGATYKLDRHDDGRLTAEILSKTSR